MRRVVLLLVGLMLLPGTRAETKDKAPKTRTVKSFTLKDGAGKSWSLADQKDSKAVVVLFLGTQCPINNAYLPRLGELHKTYAEKKVAFVGINSNSHDTPAKVLAHARAGKLPFPVLLDTGNAIADDFGARRTPEAFILAPSGKILYQGRIDDQFGLGYKRNVATKKEMTAALDEILAGKAVTTAKTEVAGCIIARAIKGKATGTITYAKHVSRILQAKCQECHRPGEVGPMPLESYNDARAWSGMIKEVVGDGRMPPWHADPKHGTWKNDRSLSKADRETLLGWIKQGCPKGDDKDLPPKKKWPTGWMIGTPDAVFKMTQEFTVPAKAPARGVPYKYFLVQTKFDEDKWVQAAEARPGSREVVHHIIVYIVDPSRMRRRGGGAGGAKPGGGRTNILPADGIGNGMLTAYAPGDMPTKLEPGQAKKLPKGFALVFQMHYTPDGVERKDRSSVGLIFAKKPPESEVRTRAIAQRWFFIPPGAKSHGVTSRSTFDRDVTLFSLLPHMHLRGKDFKYVAVYPDGKKETLLSVPKYDFNWQSTYRFAKPLRLPKGTRIECYAHFDNSEDNPNNPDPKKTVMWGDQTWQEMMIGFVDYAFVREKKETKDKKSDTR